MIYGKYIYSYQQKWISTWELPNLVMTLQFAMVFRWPIEIDGLAN